MGSFFKVQKRVWKYNAANESRKEVIINKQINESMMLFLILLDYVMSLLSRQKQGHDCNQPQNRTP